jgi:hypothetical protein
MPITGSGAETSPFLVEPDTEVLLPLESATMASPESDPTSM